MSQKKTQSVLGEFYEVSVIVTAMTDVLSGFTLGAKDGSG